MTLISRLAACVGLVLASDEERLTFDAAGNAMATGLAGKIGKSSL